MNEEYDTTYIDIISKYKDDYTNIDKISPEDFTSMMYNLYNELIKSFEIDIDSIFTRLRILCYSKKYHSQEEFTRECEEYLLYRTNIYTRYIEAMSSTYDRFYNQIHNILIKYKDLINSDYDNTITGESNIEIFESICTNLYYDYIDKVSKTVVS